LYIYLFIYLLIVFINRLLYFSASNVYFHFLCSADDSDLICLNLQNGKNRIRSYLLRNGRTAGGNGNGTTDFFYVSNAILTALRPKRKHGNEVDVY